MVVEMAVTGTVVRIEHRVTTEEFGYETYQADMLLICELNLGGEGLKPTDDETTLGVLGARVRVIDDWGLPSLTEVKVGDLVYASGDWHAPGSHDLEQEMRYMEAARDWYRLESWDAGPAGKMEVRALEMIGFDVRRFIVKEARWEQLTDEWSSWQNPMIDDGGWDAHRIVVGRGWNKSAPQDQEALDALDGEAEIGWREAQRQWVENMKAHEAQQQRAERKSKREALAKVAKTPEVEAQKEAARQLAKRRRKGKGGKRKRKRRS
ncbi:MAG: hypothetical protein OXN94_09985 [Chloroflexota bacterium]|nr:hypothetical protein [Chloroflexota bacterium]MDE2951562.1 hypothetical protein [Chloroflexota bacterium]